ncbi:MAG: DNA primase [Micromonosporaceae bacterium]
MARHRADQPEDQLDSADDGREAGLDEAGLDEGALDVDDSDDVADTDDSDDEDDSDERPSGVTEFWEKLKVAPVEIALPRGVGYTLRAYRMSDALAGEEPETPDEADLESTETDAETDADADEAKPTTSPAKRSTRGRVEQEVEDEEDDLDEELDDQDLDDEDLDDEDFEEDEDEEDEEEDEEEEEPEPEEIPVFLTQDGKLLLFRSPEGLAEFVRSGEATDLDVIEEWDTLRSTLTVDQVVVDEDDRYELDLVVENLRGGHDAWDAELLIKAGEICRDLGHALRIQSVMDALGSGSPLDKLDEAVRSVESGRIAAFFARRKLRRIAAQQAALAWRSIIGKISTSVDWRD